MELFVATPCYGGQVTQRYFHACMALMLWAIGRGIGIHFETLGRESLITRGRNTLVAKFLDRPAATHLLFIDADIGFEPAAAQRLIEFGEAVAAGMYPLKTMDWDDAAIARARAGELISTAPLRYVGKPTGAPEPQQRDGFVAADYAGTGFMLIARAALQLMTEAYPELHYVAAHDSAETPGRNLFALFDCQIDPETRHYLSEDYTFCRRWRAIGGRIWLDTLSPLTHTGTHDFIGNPATRLVPNPGGMRPNLADPTPQTPDPRA